MKTVNREKWNHLLESYKIKEQVDLKEFTTFKISSIAKYFIDVHEKEDIVKAIAFAREYNMKYFILGNGSNVLFKDPIYDGIVIHLGKHFGKAIVNDRMITVQAGALLADISLLAKEHSLSGLEFACGIPGSVGGAVFMNAGAYDGEIKHVVRSVEVIDSHLNFLTIDCEEKDFEYRSSFVQKNNFIVVGASFHLISGAVDEIQAKMEEFTSKRTSKQPLEYPSVGSAFKRPQGYFAGKLIEDSGLKGVCVGDACVSDKHCGFIINVGNATAKDVMNLVTHIQNTVYEKFGVIMEREFKII